MPKQKLIWIYVTSEGGFLFGLDAVTPVSWAISARAPAERYRYAWLVPEEQANKIPKGLVASVKSVIALIDAPSTINAYAASA